MRITTLETVDKRQKIIKKIPWQYHRKLTAIPFLAEVMSRFRNINSPQLQL